MEEINKFSKRLKRYTDLGTSAGSLAVKLLSSKFFGKENSKNAEDLTYILGNLKGPIMKIAQLASTVPDLLPPEYSKELTKLQSNAPPMGWNFVKRRMNNELGFSWQEKFDSFEKEPFAKTNAYDSFINFENLIKFFLLKSYGTIFFLASFPSLLSLQDSFFGDGQSSKFLRNLNL